MKLDGGNQRVIIEGVSPEVDGARFAAKRVVGDRVRVEADIFADGHDVISALLHVTAPDGTKRRTAMTSLVNDRWFGEFTADQLGMWTFTLEAWIDHYRTWRRDLRKRIAAGEDVAVQRQIGAAMLGASAERADDAERTVLATIADALLGDESDDEALARVEDLAAVTDRHSDRSLATHYGRVVPVQVDRERARFSSWYELFPRSARGDGRHGTLRDVADRLTYVAELGFDVLYLPPIHPIGEQFRKGKNNSPTAQKGDVGSPWAVGGTAGGHKSIHPDLGTDADFDELVARANELGIEVALDVAFQASPDHPLVKEHPEFFLWRPDKTVQYAENPPKKYQDIYPFHFEAEKWRELWAELRSVFEHWIARGVRIFRVDNPHTKPLPFWEWVINDLRREHPDVIFLAEAFTRPRVMYYLAKAGFTQGYTYFTWRTTKSDLVRYMTELTRTEVAEYFRPNFWPNTPDILPEHLQGGERAMFQSRLVLAATLAANYGIYGPAYELMEHKPRAAGAEEYLDSEKYEIRQWNLDDPNSLRHFIARVNRIRHENAALQRNDTLVFHEIDNDQLLAYSKTSVDGENAVLTIVNLDPHATHSGWLQLDLRALELDPETTYQAHDLLSGARFNWGGARQRVEINPGVAPAAIYRLHRKVRREYDFEYYF